MEVLGDWTKRIAPFVMLGLLAACDTEKEPDGDACDGGRSRCGNVCVDLRSSRTDCGACGNACDEGEACVDAVCVSVCPPGRTLCDGECVTLSSREHCGRCGNACDEGWFCLDSTCVPGCPPDHAICDGECVDLGSDSAHCGECGKACGESEICSDGACACPEGTERCGDACVDTKSDVANCGGCGQACGQDNAEDASCVDGDCQLECLSGFEDCDEDPANGCEADLSSTATCGSCGVSCREDQVCVDGACNCPEGFEDCDGACVDTRSDPSHCGGCGFSCEGRDNTVSAACVEGRCELECTGAYADCDGDAENGCEMPILSDPANCGGCGVSCRGDQLCAGGDCVCSGGRAECDGACVDTRTDPNHCNGCGNVCPGGGACAQGVCCEPGLAACGAACVDLDTDPENCGGCGNSCLDFPNTTSGTCEEGACATIACAAGFGDCNGDVTDGCEIDLSSDADNCGTCGNDTCEIGCGGGTCATVVTLSARNDHGCAILSGDGSVKCWGYNRNGQIGNGLAGTTEKAPTPEYVLDANDPVGRLRGAVQVATGFGHSCVLTQAGTVKCWGMALDPQDPMETIDVLAPYEVQDPAHPSGLLSDVVQLASGRNFLCGLLQGGGLKCWGGVPDGANPVPRVTAWTILQSKGPDVPLGGVTQVALGNTHGCVLMSDTTVKCWGSNTYGQLGTGTTDPADVPQTVGGSTPLTDVVEIALSQDHSCARKSDGTVHCWGRNNNLQLGVSGIASSPTPVQVEDVSNAVQISAGMVAHTCARLADGTAKCWGNGGNGRLGTGGTANSLPATVKDASGAQDLTGIAHIEAGNAHSCALLQSGAILCWGRNNNGQIGYGVVDSASTVVPPTAVVW